MSASPFRLGAWTLIEICITLSVCALIVVALIPNWQSFQTRQQINQILSSLQHAIDYGRYTALVEGQSRQLCPLEGNWSNGVLLTVDRGEQPCLMANMLRQWRFKTSSRITVQWQGFAGKSFIVFTPSPNNWSVNGTFLLTSLHGIHKRLIVNRVGHSVED